MLRLATRAIASARHEYLALVAFATVLTVALWMAIMGFGMTCDYVVVGEPEAFLCRHDRVRLLVSVSFHLVLALALSRERSIAVRAVSRWCVVPLVAAAMLAYEWGSAYPEMNPRVVRSIWFWATTWAMAYCCILLFRVRPNAP